MSAPDVITRVEGPKGVAEVIEVSVDGSSGATFAYEVRFQGKTYRYATLGEACIEAGNLAGASA